MFFIVFKKVRCAPLWIFFLFFKTKKMLLIPFCFCFCFVNVLFCFIFIFVKCFILFCKIFLLVLVNKKIKTVMVLNKNRSLNLSECRINQRLCNSPWPPVLLGESACERLIQSSPQSWRTLPAILARKLSWGSSEVTNGHHSSELLVLKVFLWLG